jgi:UDP-N-acetylglucosamine 2-epimerase (non-hydrolysing)
MFFMVVALLAAPVGRAEDRPMPERVHEIGGADSVIMVGNTVVDALLYVRQKIADGYCAVDNVLASSLPNDKKLVLATLRRRENVGEPLRNMLRALRTLGTDGDKLIALPVHLNPQVRGEVFDILQDAPNVWLLDPLAVP